MRKELSTVPTNCVLAASYECRHPAAVLTKKELLTELEARAKARKGTYTEIGHILGVPSSRVSEIFNAIRDGGATQRELAYDEGVKLIAAFGLEQNPAASPLPASILRLAIRHVAQALRVQAPEAQIAELAEDLRAFSEFASDPKHRQSIDAAEGFFQALQIRRPRPEEEAPQRSDLQNARETDRPRR
jgi:hypothetical protein